MLVVSNILASNLCEPRLDFATEGAIQKQWPGGSAASGGRSGPEIGFAPSRVGTASVPTYALRATGYRTRCLIRARLSACDVVKGTNRKPVSTFILGCVVVPRNNTNGITYCPLGAVTLPSYSYSWLNATCSISRSRLGARTTSLMSHAYPQKRSPGRLASDMAGCTANILRYAPLLLRL